MNTLKIKQPEKRDLRRSWLMKLFLCAILLWPTFSQAQDVQCQWAHSAGGHEVSVAPTNPVIDKTGNIYIAGDYLATNGDSLVFDDGIKINTNPYDAFIAKYDSTGDLLWVKDIPGGFWPHKLLADQSGNIYLWGQFYNNVSFGNIALSDTSGGKMNFIAKFNSSGNAVWATKLLGDKDSVWYRDFTVCNNNIYATGNFFGEKMKIGNQILNNLDDSMGIKGFGANDAFLCKYSTQGNFIWEKRKGVFNRSEMGVALTANQSDSAIYLSMGSEFLYILNDSIYYGTNAYDSLTYIFLKINSDGETIWADSIYDAEIAGMTTDGVGNVYTTGGFDYLGCYGNGVTIGNGSWLMGGPSGSAVVKFDGDNGKALWAKASVGNPGDVSAFYKGIAVDKTGNVSISGEYVNSIVDPVSQLIFDTDTLTMVSNGQFTWDTRDAFLVRYDTHGNLLQAKNIGGYYLDENSGLAGTADGNLYMTGRYFSPTISFDSITLTNSPVIAQDTTYYSRLFLAKFVPQNADTGTGINPISDKDYLIAYPNPTTGMITLQSTSNIQSVQVFNLEGRVVYQKELAKPTKQFQVNLKGQANGGYWLKIQSKTGVAVKKIVLRK